MAQFRSLLSVACPSFLALASVGVAQLPCSVPDAGGGTVMLPPPGCEYLSPNDVHEIINGLPPGTTIELAPEHAFFFPVQEICPGGALMGCEERFDSVLNLDVQGTGELVFLERKLEIPLQCVAHTGPRVPGVPVQTFDNDMFMLQGGIVGDPDFDVLTFRGGTAFGLPSPGQTTLTQLPGGNFQVDSFFDVFYEIDFVGAPGSILEGFSGTTQGTLRMEARADDPTDCATCSQSEDPFSITPGPFTAACVGADTSYWRVFDLANDCGIAGDALVKCITFGVQGTVSPVGSQPVNVRCYELTVPPAGGSFQFGDLVLLDEVLIDVPDGLDGTFFSVDTCCKLPAGSLLAVEINTPAPAGDIFFLGANPNGQTGTSYVSGACLPNPPTDVGVYGFPQNHYLIHIGAHEIIGTNTCPNNPNTTGLAGEICASGSTSVDANDLCLTAVNLPPGEFGYFLASDGNNTVDLVTLGLSNGIFCLGSATPGNIGRYDNDVQNSGPSGCFSFGVNLRIVPIAGPAVPPFYSIQPGDTWYFQAWYRDSTATPTTNNFTDSVCITFTP